MAEIVLTTLNARYIHAAFGLRYLHANLGILKEQSKILEFEISHRPHEIAEKLLQENPTILGIGVYIWNTRQVRELLGIIRRVSPQTIVVLGGPEVSFETESQELFNLCDYIITGEADHAFRELCETILSGQKPAQKIIRAPLPQVATLTYPYELYTDDDISHRVVYVEASRGCPFTCEFCLSSLDVPVRQFTLEPFLEEMKKLLQRGVRQFKFVDRTFNLHLKTSKTILQFFLDRYTPGLFVHFEMVPDRLPDALREIISKFPSGSLQFEVGIQSFNPDVGILISRRQDFTKIGENIRFLREQTGVHVHADLIAGLPGETIESFAEGFNRLVELDPQEIQVGILKRLRGTPITRHDTEWKMVYSPTAPYELLSNSLIGFPAMQRIARFSRYWDLIANSGNFTATKPLLWKNSTGAFDGFMAWSDWLYAKTGTRHAFSLKSLTTYLYEYLIEHQDIAKEDILSALQDDFNRLERTDLPVILFQEKKDGRKRTTSPQKMPERQARHSPLA